jgi:2-oxoglutarate ferredoxin oxidoreductase subunit beta
MTLEHVEIAVPLEQLGRKIVPFKPALLQTSDHHLCAGCGEPVAIRLVAEVIEELAIAQKTMAVFGHGCYGPFVTALDVETTLCLHGRAPAVATGMKRMRPECVIWTMQGDGDMVSEGLAEVLHTAARGEKITCFMLNNGVFGDTGGQMTAATVLGQRTKNTLEGRDASYHGMPITIGAMLASLEGTGYVARGAVHNAGAVSQTKKMIRRAFERQMAGHGFGLVEILTMCPTGWILPTSKGPEYLMEALGNAYPLGELKDTGSGAPITIKA